jgi:hypothetical protein
MDLSLIFMFETLSTPQPTRVPAATPARVPSIGTGMNDPTYAPVVVPAHTLPPANAVSTAASVTIF